MKAANVILRAAIALLPLSLLPQMAWAQDQAPAPAPSDQSAPPANWWDSITYTGHVEAGIAGNPQDPKDGINFGQTSLDKANTPLLNQATFIVQRPFDPKADYDTSFKFQPLIGSDARYTHSVGLLGDAAHNSNIQYDVLEAWVSEHTPWLGEGGTDIKFGKYVTPMGTEVVDATGNFFYSHSYEYNFGVPITHFGGYAVSHVIPELDIYYGADSGMNTTPWDDNNNSGALLGGFGLNLMDGNLTILALTHAGPDTPHNNHSWRYENDILFTYKASDALSLGGEANWIKDDAGFTGQGANAYGYAQYVTYTINDWLSAGGRAEVYRDNNGFFVGQFGNNSDFMTAEEGNLTTSAATRFPGRETYGEFTLGLNIKPPVPDQFAAFNGIVFRPEFRYDTVFSPGKPFIGETQPTVTGTSDHQYLISADVIVPFSL